jgi:hypothetical protein
MMDLLEGLFRLLQFTVKKKGIMEARLFLPNPPGNDIIPPWEPPPWWPPGELVAPQPGPRLIRGTSKKGASLQTFSVSTLVVRGDIGNAGYGTPGNASLAVALAKPISLLSLDGTYLTGGPGGEYLQLHDTTLLLAGGVPAYSFYLPYAGPINLPSISSTMAPMLFRYGLTIAVSSTDATYTASASTMDLFVTYEQFELTQPPGTYETNAGDLTTTRDHLQVWADGDPHRLQRIIVQNQIAATKYLRIEADDSSGFDSAVLQLPVAASSTVQMDFGINGLTPLKVTTAGVQHNGCTMRLVDSPTYPSAVTPNSAIMLAISRPLHDAPYW